MSGAVNNNALDGVLERIIYANEETHFCIATFKQTKGTAITISGVLPGIQCGETLSIQGDWVTHPQYGRQFKVAHFEARLPSTVYGIRKYLGSGLIPGIGKVYADKIVDLFGRDTLEVISEHSGRLREVPGIGQKRAKDIKAAWDEQQAIRDVLMFLQTYGVSVSQCLRLVKKYGNQAKGILQEDPYRVAREIDGIGFKTADKIAINLGFANDSPQRIDAGVLHVVKEQESDGHTAVSPTDLQDIASELLQANPGLVRERIGYLTDSGELHAFKPLDLLQLPHMSRWESSIAGDIRGLLDQTSSLPPIKIDKAVEWAQERAGFDFAPEQAEAVAAVLRHKVSVITGGPGTGKTTILRAVVSILRAKKVKIIQLAPTGRAAQRMTESTGCFAATIHRGLKYNAATRGFEYNENHPLNAGVVIVDEASMLDTWLAFSLLRSIPKQAHCIFVGDVNQLPSVGAGNILKDIIASKMVQVVSLKQIFRQKKQSRIVTVAHEILSGQSRPPSIIKESSQLKSYTDLAFLQALTPEDCLAKCLGLYAQFNQQGYDPQILAPMHRGIAGIANLNKSVQDQVQRGRKGLPFGDQYYCVGDRVIQTRNDYDKNIFNGDIGTVTQVDKDASTLEVDFGEGDVSFKRMDLIDLSLAYAISIHKSQGSEFPVVIMPLLKQHFMMLQRNLIYTGITRARRKVVIVGDPGAYAMAVQNNKSIVRRTALLPRVTGGL